MPGWKGLTAAALMLISGTAQAQDGTDWPNLQRYAKANAELPLPAPNEDRVVFMGNSIFDKWAPYAARKGIVYLDYHSAMADERMGMKSDLSGDGVHPNEAGYRVMAPLTEAAIREALRR